MTEEKQEVYVDDDLPVCRLSPTSNPEVFLDRDTGILYILEDICLIPSTLTKKVLRALNRIE